MGLNQLTYKFAHSDDPTEEQPFEKRLILIIALCCSFFGIVWGIIYYIIFGFGVTMLLPWAFTIIVGITILVSHLLSDHRPLIYVQLFCITWIAAFIQWTIGSMDHSGVVIAWSFLGPLGAIIFLSTRQAMVWMVIFLMIVVFSAVFEPALLGHRLLVNQNVKTIFYIMNLGTASLVVFGASMWFISTIQKEKRKSGNLLQKIHTLFGQHVSEEVAEELITNESDDNTGKTRNVTVMFLDIRDFTKFADSKDPDEVAQFQNTVFGEFINIVRENKGTVNQVMGDGMLAVFGTPIVTDNHPLDAINCGFLMINKVKELSEKKIIPTIKLGIGLHTGNVIAGEVGNEFRKFYSLAGSNVIVAARIEQLNKTLNTQFLISDSVYSFARNSKYSFRSRGQHELKGLSKPIEIYELY